ncbi:MAG: alpha/beta hydrolase [Acidimicrobiales bacterium]
MAARPAVYGHAVGDFVRRFAFAPRYGPEEALSLVTADGVALSGARLAGPPDAFATVVLVHGLVQSSRTPRIHAFARLLARSVHVVVPELRGHGRSGGLCSLGREEPLDVDAAVRAARGGAGADLPVVTVGLSLGGASVLLHAGTFGGVAGVVAISAPARWDTWDTPATIRVRRSVGSPFGRFLLTRLLQTRVATTLEAVPDAREIVAAIAPAFTLVVHDPADHYFGEEHAHTLLAWAREPKDLWWVPGAGHGTDLLSPALADRLVADLRRRLSAVQ